MKSLSPALVTELGLVITRPGYLVQLELPVSGTYPAVVLRLSTIGDVTTLGENWTSDNIKISALTQEGKGMSSCTIELGNTELFYSSLLLSRGSSNIPISIYSVYAGTTESVNIHQVFSGSIDGATINENKVTLNLVSEGSLTLFSPRKFINKFSGFNYLQAVGTKIVFKTETFILERTAI